MTADQVWNFCELNQHFECKDCEEEQVLAFRNNRLDYYKNDPERRTGITYADMDKVKDEEHLVKIINKGYEVDCITRITGYMAKTSHFNKGKQAELKDRRKFDVGETQSGCNSACPIAERG